MSEIMVRNKGSMDLNGSFEKEHAFRRFINKALGME
jgi:hypothetical protein